jgi:hypothetical protein
MKAILKDTRLPQSFQVICSDISLGTQSVEFIHLVLYDHQRKRYSLLTSSSSRTFLRLGTHVFAGTVPMPPEKWNLLIALPLQGAVIKKWTMQERHHMKSNLIKS